MSETHKNGGRHVENHIKWSIIYIVPHGVVTERINNKAKENGMSRGELTFFGWSRYGQKIYLYDSPTHKIKFFHEKVDGGMSEPVDGNKLEYSIYYDMSDAYQKIAKAYLKKNGYDYCKEEDDWRWMPMKMATTVIPEADLPQPADEESYFDMLRRWTKGEMTDYEEIELVNNLTQQQIIKGAQE